MNSLFRLLISTFIAFQSQPIFSSDTCCPPATVEIHTQQNSDLDNHNDSEEDHIHDKGEASGFHDGEVSLPDSVIKNLNLKFSRAIETMPLLQNEFQGQIKTLPEKTFSIVSKISGFITEIKAFPGDTVTTGEVLAVIRSSELLKLTTEYAATAEKRRFAQTRLDKEKKLYEKKVSSENEYLASFQEFRDISLTYQSLFQELLLLDIIPVQSDSLDKLEKSITSTLEIRSPLTGRITSSTIVSGQWISGNDQIFVISDLSLLRADIRIFDKYSDFIVNKGPVLIKDHNSGYVEFSEVSFFTGVVNPDDRTLLFSAQLDNSFGQWIPGALVTAVLQKRIEGISSAVPQESVIIMENKNVVFLKKGEKLIIRPVTVSHTSSGYTGIVSGVFPGNELVTEGTFRLKSAIVTSGMDPHAGHGH